jgi:hypothetical protein
VCRPVMAIMSIDETADMENSLVAPESFQRVLANRANPASTFHIPFCGQSSGVRSCT